MQFLMDKEREEVSVEHEFDMRLRLWTVNQPAKVRQLTGMQCILSQNCNFIINTIA